MVGTFCRGNEGHTCICQFLFPFPRAKVGVDDIKIGKGHLCGFCRRKSEVDGKLGFAAARSDPAMMVILLESSILFPPSPKIYLSDISVL